MTENCATAAAERIHLGKPLDGDLLLVARANHQRRASEDVQGVQGLQGVVVLDIAAKRAEQLASILAHLENDTFTITSRGIFCPNTPPTADTIVTRVRVTSSGHTQELIDPVLATLDEFFPGMVRQHFGKIQ